MTKLGMVAYVSNPSYMGGRSRGLMVWGQPKQKVSETQSEK
jgi:hypothetical protein